MKPEFQSSMPAQYDASQTPLFAASEGALVPATYGHSPAEWRQQLCQVFGTSDPAAIAEPLNMLKQSMGDAGDTRMACVVNSYAAACMEMQPSTFLERLMILQMIMASERAASAYGQSVRAQSAEGQRLYSSIAGRMSRVVAQTFETLAEYGSSAKPSSVTVNASQAIIGDVYRSENNENANE